ncbi:VOC family protein [Burkholderia gladioli]|uniref:VOC family protein n=1 Tax=Burkholderia gladioli TaxID=28095 RepID=UPI000CDA5BDF|nr:lactoylglutathione lyase [Burkholderia gladioli]MBA1363585.1 VOC family protein [Burkholderia gladioli]POS06201.1 lactoylglutathione lyase [Burkholderia gladioli]
MPIPMTRLILYTQDVRQLKCFYQTYFALPLREEIEGEWVVLDAGGIELALHRVGEAYRSPPGEGAARSGTGSNAKFVFRIEAGIEALHDSLLKAGVPMRGIKRYDGFPYRLCDGTDPEGNVFQLMQADAAGVATS